MRHPCRVVSQRETSLHDAALDDTDCGCVTYHLEWVRQYIFQLHGTLRRLGCTTKPAPHTTSCIICMQARTTIDKKVVGLWLELTTLLEASSRIQRILGDKTAYLAKSSQYASLLMRVLETVREVKSSRAFLMTMMRISWWILWFLVYAWTRVSKKLTASKCWSLYYKWRGT